MSIAIQISRIQTDRNTIRTKLVELGMAQNSDNLDKLATAVEGIENRGAVSATVQEGDTYTIPKGYHNGNGTVTGTGRSSLSSISITTPPMKAGYKSGEIFDPTGMVVTATFSDGETVKVDESGLTFSPSGGLTISDTQISVSFTFGGETKTATQQITVVATYVFGVMWDSIQQSTVMTRLTKENDPYHLVDVDITTEPNPAVGAGAGSSPFDNYLPWKGMDEYNIIDNDVCYKRGDAGFSRTNYDTVVYIPEFWYKVIKNGTKTYWYTSDTAKEGFERHPGSGKYVGRYSTGANYVSKSGLVPMTNITRAQARNGSTAKGTKWCQYDFAAWGAVEYLFRVEFADWDSQAKVGRGIVNDSATHSNGETDSMTYHTGRTAGGDGQTAVQYRHIENPWGGNVWEWVDGINFNDRSVYICLDHTKYADDTVTGYTNTGVTLPLTGWITNIGMSNAFPWAFLPNEIGGSDSTCIPDYAYTNAGWRSLRVGGAYADGLIGGMWCFTVLSASSDSNGYVGARLLYNQDENELQEVAT